MDIKEHEVNLRDLKPSTRGKTTQVNQPILTSNLKHNEKSFYDMWGFGKHGQLDPQEGTQRKGSR
jgi:hypothetical protein